MYCQNNLALALLEHKSQLQWDDLNLSATQLDLIGCISPKKDSITADPTRRMFLGKSEEHGKSIHPYTDSDFIKSKKLPQKYKKPMFL